MTIYALSSGPGIAGISVIRVSGPGTKEVISKLTNNKLPIPRIATRRKFMRINKNQLIDEGYSIHIDTLKKSEKNQLKNAIKMNASFYLRCNELIELKNLSSKEECVINNITDLKKFTKS